MVARGEIHEVGKMCKKGGVLVAAKGGVGSKRADTIVAHTRALLGAHVGYNTTPSSTSPLIASKGAGKTY